MITDDKTFDAVVRNIEISGEATGTVDRPNGVRLLARVHEIDQFVCPRSGSEMKVIAVIQFWRQRIT